MLCSKLFLFLASASLAGGANILLVSTVPSISHSFWYDNIAVLLAGHGHQVTLINTKPPKKQAANVTHYIINKKNLFSEELSELETFSKDTSSFLTVYLILGGWTTVECEHLMKSNAIDKFLSDFKGKKNPFDLVIFDGGTCECFISLVDFVGRPPLIVATAFDATFGFKLFFGNSDNPSFSPNLMTMIPDKMSFLQRVENTLVDGFSRFMFHFVYLPGQNRIAREVVGEKTPSVEEISRNATLFFIGTHYSFRDVKPHMPNVIPIAGIHLLKHEKLPTDLSSFLDGAKEGAIFMSFGSNVLCEWIPEERRAVIIEAFRQMKYRVLWTCNVEGMKLPPNVKVAKWFPQKDILAHPNLKVFVSHGGLLSFQEAMYYGVPMVVVPFFCDQHSTARRIVEKGIGVSLLYHELNSPSLLVNSVEKVISDPRFKNRATDVSRLFKPFADSTKSTFLYWVDFVINNPDIHFPKASSVDLYWFQLILLDVVGFLLAIAFVTILTAYYIIRCSIRLICKPKKGKKVKTK